MLPAMLVGWLRPGFVERIVDFTIHDAPDESDLARPLPPMPPKRGHGPHLYEDTEWYVLDEAEGVDAPIDCQATWEAPVGTAIGPTSSLYSWRAM
jgi:hypothetical protein